MILFILPLYHSFPLLFSYTHALDCTFTLKQKEKEQEQEFNSKKKMETRINNENNNQINANLPLKENSNFNKEANGIAKNSSNSKLFETIIIDIDKESKSNLNENWNIINDSNRESRNENGNVELRRKCSISGKILKFAIGIFAVLVSIAGLTILLLFIYGIFG